MTGRDRIVLMVVVVLAVLAAGWMLVVSPERNKASKLDAQVTSAKAQLSSAEGELSSARSAQEQYASAYSSIVNLGKAVPAEEEVPSLIYQLSQATHQQNVEFASIASPITPGAATPGAATPGAVGAAAGATAAAGFSQMPFTFVFNGHFFELERLFNRLTAFTDRTATGALQVRGRLLTIQSVKLAPATESAAGGKGSKGVLQGAITATAYRLAGGQGLTGGATSASPTGTSTPATSTTPGANSTTAPAIARVTP
jgi:Tfp pilus assembly protein PilO